MLTKLLLTLLVIIGCYFLLQLQRRRALPSSGQVGAQQHSGSSSSKIKWLLLALVGLIVTVTLVLTLMDWQDKRVLVEVRVINPVTGEEQRYEAYRSALQGRQFTTINGLQVQLSEAERVEVREVTPLFDPQ